MLSKGDYKILLDKSMAELQLMTQAHQSGWGIGDFERWDLDQNDGNLVFSNRSGMQAICPAQVIGSLDTHAGTWLWAWANPSVFDALKRDALKVRQFGQENHIEKLTTPEWKASEEDAWQMAALAVKLCGAQGAYRGPGGSTTIFISFSAVQLRK